MDYVKLRKGNELFINIYKSSFNTSLKLIENERSSCINIQRVFRGDRSRVKILHKSKKCNEIQRVFRGHMARKQARLLKKLKINKRVKLLLELLSLQLQRIYRGFYSRKYRANHSRRKNFMSQILEKSIEVREQLYKYATEQALLEERVYQEKKMEQFKKYAENLHHLVSTKHIRGVLNPNPQYITTPTMGNKPIEDHVRGYVRDLLRTRGIAKTGLEMDLHGSRKIPLAGLKTRLSLQASSRYDSIQVEEKKQAYIHKVITAGKGTFQSGGKTDVINIYAPPMTTGDPYLDTWANPMLIKGVPQSQEQFNEVAYTRKALFVTHLDRPFYTRADGNKSTVHPNNIFDVIADAEETGGAAQRQMGNTSRFGVPSTADKRPLDKSPSIPLRASTVKAPRRKFMQQKVRVRPATVDEMMRSSSAKENRRNNNTNTDETNTITSSICYKAQINDDSSSDEGY